MGRGSLDVEGPGLLLEGPKGTTVQVVADADYGSAGVSQSTKNLFNSATDIHIYIYINYVTVLRPPEIAHDTLFFIIMLSGPYYAKLQSNTATTACM